MITNAVRDSLRVPPTSICFLRSSLRLSQPCLRSSSWMGTFCSECWSHGFSLLLPPAPWLTAEVNLVKAVSHLEGDTVMTHRVAAEAGCSLGCSLPGGLRRGGSLVRDILQAGGPRGQVWQAAPIRTAHRYIVTLPRSRMGTLT